MQEKYSLELAGAALGLPIALLLVSVLSIVVVPVAAIWALTSPTTWDSFWGGILGTDFTFNI